MDKEYIEREAAKRELLSWAVSINHPEYLMRDDAMHIIDSFPAADVAPVRHGRWITEFDDLGWLKHTCTVCGYVKRTDVHVSLGWNYCPNCGAKMDGAEND